MKKVGIITLKGYHNYGNLLQNYALQETLKNLGFYVETILINNMYHKKLKYRRLMDKKLIDILTKIIEKINGIRYKSLISKRKINFIRFANKYLNEKVYDIENLNCSFDYFVVGSDQVWNPYYVKNDTTNFLTFASKEKRIAYAASFGVSEIPLAFKDVFVKGLNEMYAISTREHKGAEIIKHLTGKEVDVLVDPTLLLSKLDWSSIKTQSKYRPSKNYLLTYFLGKKSQQYRKYIEDTARHYNLEIVNLNDYHDPNLYVVDPSEFLDLIENASLVCTDSFHGTVFSIVFNRPFVVFERLGAISMSSRISTLLNLFNLENRKFVSINNNYTDIFNCDFSSVEEIIHKEKTKAIKYLRKSLNIS